MISNEPATNQVAELRAVINAILKAKRDGKRSILIYTDSEYAAEAINGRLDGWKRNGWLACNNKTVINKKALMELSEAMNGIKVLAIRLPGHSGIAGNEKADQLAKSELVALIRPENDNEDHEIRIILEQMESDDAIRDKYIYEDGKLYLISRDDKGKETRKLLITKSQRNVYLYFAHDNDMFGGHMGVKKTLSKLSRYYWPGMAQQVANYVKTCDVCQLFREEKGLKQGFMHILLVRKAFETVYMDLICPIHPSYDDNKIIITLIDGYTRFGIARAYNQVLSETLVDFVRDEVILQHGLIKKIICDNGSVFKSQVFQDSMKKLGIEIQFICPYNPQANGRVERWNGTLKSVIKKYTDKQQFHWDKYLNKAIYIYNTTRHCATNYSPYELLYGRANRNPFNLDEPENYQFGDFDPDRLLTRELACENMNKAALISKYYYDKKHRASEFVEGQDILVRHSALPLRISRKLAHKWLGPFKLIKIIGGKDDPKAIIYADDQGKLQRAAIQNAKPYHARDESENMELQEIVKRYETDGIPAL